MNQNHPYHLNVMNIRYLLTEKSFNSPSIRSTEARNLEINKALIQIPRLTSRAGALTCKAVILTLDQEHPTNYPEK